MVARFKVCFSFICTHSRVHQECRMGSACQITSSTPKRQASSGVHLVEKQMFTHREQTPYWLFSIFTATTITLPLGCHQYVKGKGKGNNSIWRHTCAPFVSTLVHFTFRVNDEDIDIEEDNDGEFIKGEPHTTPLRNLLHFMVIEKSNLFMSDIFN